MTKRLCLRGTSASRSARCSSSSSPEWCSRRPAWRRSPKHRHAPFNHSNGLSISSSSFGNLPATAPGRRVTKYTLSNARGMSVSILDYGGVIQSRQSPRPARPRGPTSRSASATSTATPTPHTSRATRTSARSSAATATASARWAARLQHPGFVLGGNTYTLDANNGVTSLHGGNVGFDKRMWDATPIPANGKTVGLKLHRLSPAGEGCTTPATCTGLPRQRRRVGHLHAGQQQQPALRLRGDHHPADGPQPHQPLLLEPGR